MSKERKQNLKARALSNGFTLLELIVAMSIIAIVTTSLWGNFFTSLTKGRDARRKQDLESVTKALELYYNDNKAYPAAIPTWGVPFIHPTNTAVIYMQKLPTDPAYPESTYCYSSNGTYYKLYANLENRNDSKIFTTPIPCNSVNYNYGISSPNVQISE